VVFAKDLFEVLDGEVGRFHGGSHQRFHPNVLILL
jgi:hypothetical protein